MDPEQMKQKEAELATKQSDLERKEAELKQQEAELEAQKATIGDYETKKSALDAELKRVQGDIATTKEDRRKQQQQDQSFQERMRNENLAIAKSKFFSEFKIEAEAQDKFLAEFKRFDSGAVNADLILADMKKVYAFLNADALIESKRRVDTLAQSSEEFKSALSSTGFAGDGMGVRTDASGLTPEDVQAAQWAGIPLERYKQLKQEGKV